MGAHGADGSDAHEREKNGGVARLTLPSEEEKEDGRRELGQGERLGRRGGVKWARRRRNGLRGVGPA